MNPRTLKILLKKEVSLIKRNPIIPRLIVGMPVLVMLIIPLVTTLDVKNVGVVVVDNDRTELSRRLIADMNASEYLSVTGCFFTYDEAFQQIENGEADALVAIPENYLNDLTNGHKPTLALKANGVNATKGMLGAQYATQSLAHTLAQWQAEQGIAHPLPAPSVINRYNPTLNFRNYMIPALMVVLLMAMNVTPVGRLEFVLSKLIPYWVVGILVVTVGMLIGWLVYGLVPEGNIALVYLAAILFSLVMSALGVFIANRSTTILQSIFLMFAFIVVFQLMSGLFTPIERGYPGRPVGALRRPLRLCPAALPCGGRDV